MKKKLKKSLACLLAALLIMVNATAASSDGMFNQKENTKVSTSMIQ